jgi:hypothetical protein
MCTQNFSKEDNECNAKGLMLITDLPTYKWVTFTAVSRK